MGNVLRTNLLIATCVCALVMSRVESAEPLTVIELRHRTAEELLPVLRQLAGQASISGVDYKLLVRGSADDVAQLREVLTLLDRASRQLRVSVRYVTDGSMANNGVRVTIDGNSGAVGAGAGVSTASDTAVSSVQVLEGSSAHIAAGESTPIVTAALVGTRRIGGTTGAVVGYQETVSGFTVTPRINADRVFLDISSQQQRAAGSVAAGTTSQSITTTLSARLGEWTELGGVTKSGVDSANGVSLTGGTRRTSTHSDRRTIEVKVDVID